MIHVTIFQNKYKECVGFQTEGHAEYANPGQDIVCAAASILVINTINAIEEFTEDDASLISEDGDGNDFLSSESSFKRCKAFAECNDSWPGTDGR